MFARIIAFALASSLLLQVGIQAITLGWYALNNQSFTEKFCQNWEEEVPMCFGSCKVTDAFVATVPAQEQLTPTPQALQQSLYYLIAFGARPQDAKEVIEQSKNGKPAYTTPAYAHQYVGSVFWPPAA